MDLTLQEMAASYGATLALAEVGVGSALHALKIPFSGQCLSLNQGYLLSRATLDARGSAGARTLALPVSAVAALLKTLSPAGKKLTPMLAITAQGCLFTLGVVLGGVNPFGLGFGMALLCLWAFLQPAITAYALFGHSLVESATYFVKEMTHRFDLPPQSFVWGIAGVVGFKILLSWGLLVAAYRTPSSIPRAYARLLLRAGKKRLAAAAPAPSPLRGALRDLTRPWFVASFLLTVGFFWFCESPLSELWWVAARPVAVGFIFFYGLRAVPLTRVARAVEQGRFPVFGRVLTRAMEILDR